MKNNTKIKTLALLMIFVVAFGFMPAMSLAAVPAGSVNAGQGVETNCFRQFEICLNNARTSFLGGFIDGLDCELALARCLKNVLV